MGPNGALDLVAKLDDPRIAARIELIRRGQQPTGPVVVDLDPTSFCDLACPTCISQPVLSTGRFSRDRLRSIASELSSLEVLAVVLIGGGEPLIHPGTSELICALSAADMQVGVVTNGTLIERHYEALSQHTAWVRVSVDAASADTYRLVRPAGGSRASQFDRVTRGIKRLTESSAVKVGYSFMIFPPEHGGNQSSVSNIHEIAAGAAVAKSLGCAYFELKGMMNADHTLVELPDSDRELILDQLSKAESIAAPGFEVLISSNLRLLLQKSVAPQNKAYSQCAVTLLRTLVTPQGMYPCSYHRGNEAFQHGDAALTDLGTLWRDRNRPSPDPRSDCRFFCARHEMNEAIGSGRAFGSQEMSINDVDPFI